MIHRINLEVFHRGGPVFPEQNGGLAKVESWFDYAAKLQNRVATRMENRPSKVHNCAVFDWNDLKYFLAVARNGSTLAAAKALGTKASQPSIGACRSWKVD